MSIFQTLSEIIGLPDDQIRLLSGFLLCVPIGQAFHFIKSRSLRVNIGTIVGLGLTWMVYQEAMLSIIIQNFIVYFMVKTLGKKCAYPVFFQTLIFVALHHLYRQYTDYGGWRMDITTILMMDTCKWTSFAWCVQDGLTDESKLTEEQKKRKITKLPSFEDFFGYIFFYAGSVAGPAYDYFEWDEFMDLKGNYKTLPSASENLKESLWLLGKAAIFSGILMGIGPLFPLEHIVSEEFNGYGFVYKIIWMNIMITVIRTKYISGWFFSEASLASSGFTFNGYKEKTPIYGRIRSIDPQEEVEDIPKKVKLWNISVQNWLAKYVYLRVYDPKELKDSPKKQQIAQQATYFVSAFWHGFYPGYYISFIQWATLTQLQKYISKASDNLNIMPKTFLNGPAKWLRFFFYQTLFNAYGVGFQLLSIEKNISFFQSYFWSLNIINVVPFFFFIFTGFGQRSPKPKETKKD